MIIAEHTMLDVIDPIAIQALESRLLGKVILRDNEEYENARRIHDVLVDKYPTVIVRAVDAADVIRTVEFARDRALPLAVRSGGHSLAGYSTVDGGVVLDLSNMKAVAVDPVKQTAWMQPGARTRDLIAAAEPHGLGLSTGDTASVGIGGLALGGGIGFMVRKHGLTIDKMISAEVVTADGRLIVASATQNADLFWAVRGGGGNFGVVTGFEFKLEPVGAILGGVIVLPATPEVLRGYARYSVQAPDELTTIANLMVTPPMAVIPEGERGKPALLVFACYAGDAEEAQRALDPIRALAEPIAEKIGPMPYADLYRFTKFASRPHAMTVRSGFMKGLSDEVIDTMLRHVHEKTSQAGLVQLRGLGGAMARVSNDETAFAHRDKSIFLAIIGGGPDAADDAWVFDLWDLVRPMTSGVYVNFLGEEGEFRVREAYPGETYARLAAVKRRYDPENVFRLNQNVKPGVTAAS